MFFRFQDLTEVLHYITSQLNMQIVDKQALVVLIKATQI